MTTTSNGKTTVTKTVTVIDGVKKVVIETTDENGETIRTESGGDSTPEGSKPKPWIGLRVSEVSEILRDQLDLSDEEGLVVEFVAEDSPAMKSGIRVGDLLLALGDDPVSSKETLSRSLFKHQVGDEVQVTVMRKAKRVDLKTKLEAAPKQEAKEVPAALRQALEKSSVKSVAVTGTGFDSLLNNPDLPESFKKSIREMQKTLREFEKEEK